LVVDDQLESGAVLARVLKNCGHDAIALGSGQGTRQRVQRINREAGPATDEIEATARAGYMPFFELPVLNTGA
jgi:CheY-like chemotaxis protein